MSGPNIHQQIEEIDRELRMRSQVYPSQVSRGKMRAVDASTATARMEAVRATLVWCRDNRELLAEAQRLLAARAGEGGVA